MSKTLTAPEVTSPRLLSDALVQLLDESLVAAVRDVEDRGVAQVQVAVLFKIELDPDEGEPTVSFVHKSTTTQKGEMWRGSARQLRSTRPASSLSLSRCAASSATVVRLLG